MFFLFTLLHVFANLKAVKAVTMETLNRARYMIILKQFASTNYVASVREVNRLEPVVMGLIPTGNFIILWPNQFENELLTFLFTLAQRRICVVTEYNLDPQSKLSRPKVFSKSSWLIILNGTLL